MFSHQKALPFQFDSLYGTRWREGRGPAVLTGCWISKELNFIFFTFLSFLSLKSTLLKQSFTNVSSSDLRINHSHHWFLYPRVIQTTPTTPNTAYSSLTLIDKLLLCAWPATPQPSSLWPATSLSFSLNLTSATSHATTSWPLAAPPRRRAPPLPLS